MKQDIKEEKVNYYPLKVLEDNEEMLKEEFARITRTAESSTEHKDLTLALDRIKEYLSQIEELRKIVNNLGISDLY